MRIIMASFGSYGDIRPFLAAGNMLREDGHAVSVIANPYFGQSVRDEGFDFHPAGTLEDYHAAAGPAGAAGGRPGGMGERIAASRRLFTRMFMNPAKDTLEAVCSLSGEGAVVFGHLFAYGAKLAAEKFGLPFVNVCLSPHWLKGFEAPVSLRARISRAAAAAGTAFIDGQLFTEPMNALRAGAGLGPMRTGSARWMLEGETLCLYPSWLQDFTLEEGMHAEYAGFPLPSDSGKPLPQPIEDFLQRHERPVVFTPGSAVTDTGAFFGSALEALRRLGRPGILLSRSAQSLPDRLPAYAAHADFAPLGALLPRCAALVHHGGIGTAAQALACGTPQIICPRIDEQAENARLLGRLGVCETLRANRPNGNAMARALERLLGSAAAAEACRAAAARNGLGLSRDILTGTLRHIVR